MTVASHLLQRVLRLDPPLTRELAADDPPITRSPLHAYAPIQYSKDLEKQACPSVDNTTGRV